jgi:Tol biopolymer transport system component
VIEMMTKTLTKKITNQYFGVPVALVVLAMSLSMVSGARPAEAASPGTNGKVAFASNRDGDFEVFTMNPDGNDEVYSMFATGTSQSNVSRAPSADSGPSWQPLPTTYTVNSI